MYRYSQLGDGALGDDGVVGEVGDHRSPPRRPPCPAASAPPLCPAPAAPTPPRRRGPRAGSGQATPLSPPLPRPHPHVARGCGKGQAGWGQAGPGHADGPPRSRAGVQLRAAARDGAQHPARARPVFHFLFPFHFPFFPPQI